MDAAYASHFRGTLPARTVVEVAHLPGDARVQSRDRRAIRR